jgi:Ni/Co efflux regulator RcnB
MKNTLIASALIALSMAASGSALAQRGDHGQDRNDYGSRVQQHDGDRAVRSDRDDRNDRYDRSGRNDRSDRYDRNDRDGRYDRNDRYDGPRNHANNYRDHDARRYYRDDNRGGGPRHNLRRGQRLDREYRDNRYVVSDWQARRLSAPPRGHHWVRAGNDYVLAAIATGLIAHVLFSN